MRVPANYFTSVKNHDQRLVPAMAAVSSRHIGRRNRLFDSVGLPTIIHQNSNRPQIDNINRTSPRPASEVGSSQSTPPPELPSFLKDPVMNRTYARGRYLGKGGFAFCFEVTDIQTRENFALKVVSKAQCTSKRNRTKVLREISIHQQLRHKNVVRLYSAFEDEQNIYIVLELCGMDSMMAVIKKRKTLTECEIRYYMIQLLSGVHYLHEEARILHRDLKLGNMLLTDQMEVKIADFGLAAELGNEDCDSVGHVCGTPNYISPEVLRREGHSRASDAWAIGCTMFAMLVGKPPFETYSLESTYALIQQCQYSYPHDVRVSTAARDLIRQFLNPKPSRRPTAAQALAHEFFASGIPVLLPPSCCHSSLDTSQLTFYDHHTNPAPRAATAVTANGHRDESAVHMVFLRPEINVASNYRSSTALVALEERTRLCGQAGRTGLVSAAGIVSLTSGSRGHGPFNVPSDMYSRMSGGSVTGPYSSLSASTSGPNGNIGAVNAICPLDARGNVTFGPDGEIILSQWLHEVYQTLTEMLVFPQGALNAFAHLPVSSDNILYVTKWIDYSNRFGFGCQFNNGAVSVMQNDWTRLCLSPTRRYCRRWHADRTSISCVNESDLLDLHSPDNTAGSSVQVMRHFVEYMDANLMTGGLSAVSTALTTAVPFIILWRRFSEYLLMVLSDGTFQVNFIGSHTKAILSPWSMAHGQTKPEIVITFIDATRTVRTCALKSAVGSIIDTALLQRVRQVLVDHVLSPTHCFMAEI